MRRLVFADVVTAEISRRSWKFQTQMADDLKLLKAEKIDSFVDATIGTFLDSSGWIDGKKCENLHSLLMQQMDDLTLAAASKGLYAPIFPDYATPEMIKDTYEVRLAKAVKAAIDHSKEINVKNLPIKVGPFESSSDAFAHVESFYKSIESEDPVGGATVNAALQHVIVFLQLIVSVQSLYISLAKFFSK